MATWKALLGTLQTTFRIGLGKSTLDASAITAPRNHVLPDQSGTLALTSQLGGGNGISTVNFDAFPGSTDTTTVIMGQGGIFAGSNVEAWLVATATADHSADEHWADPPKITAGSIVAGVGFTIYAASSDRRAYGLWSVAWRWS